MGRGGFSEIVWLVLEDEFPEYSYSRASWLAEAPFREPGLECAAVA